MPSKKGNSLKQTESMVEVFFRNAAEKPETILVHYKKAGGYRTLNRRVMMNKVRNLAKYLIKKGVKKGDRVVIFSFNRYEWWVADLAILSIGAVNVPIYPTNSAEEAKFILNNSGATFCFTGDADQKSKILSVKNKCRSIKEIIVFEDSDSEKSVKTFSSVLKEGEKLKNDKELDKRIAAIKGSDLASILYTSGTTGHPKGVALTHFNFYSDADQVCKVFRPVIDDGEIFMSFLPLSHALERVAAYYAVLLYGAQVAFADGIKTIVEDMKEIRPTVLNSVPRLYEKIHSGIETQISAYPLIKRLIVKGALKAGSAAVPALSNGQMPTGLTKIFNTIADRIVLSKIRHEIGMDRIKVAISGGAALAFSDIEFLMSLGISVYEGYGLTECAPILTVNKPGKIKPGTVGPAMCDTEITLSDEGEILAKGPQIMKAYYKNPKATKEVFDKKGYFKTGDLGMIDGDGYLRITGRIKDIIVTAGGKNISPQNIENALKKSRFVEQIAVIGDKRKYLTAIIIANREEVVKLAKSLSLNKSTAELLKDQQVIDHVADEIAKLLTGFARVEQIRRFTLLFDEWTQASGELTGTLKIKRRVIEEKYKEIIEGMYKD